MSLKCFSPPLIPFSSLSLSRNTFHFILGFGRFHSTISLNSYISRCWICCFVFYYYNLLVLAPKYDCTALSGKYSRKLLSVRFRLCDTKMTSVRGSVMLFYYTWYYPWKDKVLCYKNIRVNSRKCIVIKCWMQIWIYVISCMTHTETFGVHSAHQHQCIW